MKLHVFALITFAALTLSGVCRAENSQYYTHIYKMQPCDTTMATIDEFRISKKAWTTTEIQDEMTLSRYYLPRDTSNPTSDSLPYFISQSLIQSLEGNKVSSDDQVALARVSWNVFTPRFMHEYKIPDPGRFVHHEIIEGGDKIVPIRGPFDYAQYNRDIDYDANQGWKGNTNPIDIHRGVKRVLPQLANGEQSSWSKGVTVDLVTYPATATFSASTKFHAIDGFVIDRLTNKSSAIPAFKDPEAENCFINPGKPTERTLAKAGELHYRVRFQYPVDRKYVDSFSRFDYVDPSTQYLLDTPVFDDISIVYVQAPKILYFKESVE